MRPTFRIVMTAFVALCAAPALGAPRSEYHDLGLRPRWEDPAFAKSIPDIHERLRQIDTIENSADWLDTPSDSLRVKLIELYRASPLMKHRIQALELAERLPPELQAEQLGLTYSQTYNPWSARKQFAAWIDMDTTTAAPFVREGTLILNRGLAAWDSLQLREAALDFRQATTKTGATARVWRGLAAALTGLRRYTALRPVAEKLVELDAESPGPLLYLALAHEAAGLTHRSSQEFTRAMSRMDPVSRAKFEIPGGKVILDSPGPGFDDVVQRPEPAAMRGWWVRVLEAEVLFSDPDAEVHGWDTPPGEAYLLFGRPRLARIVGGGEKTELGIGNDFGRYTDAIKNMIWSAQKGTGQFWVWLIPLPSGHDLPLVFERFTRFADWHATETLEAGIIGPQRRAGAVQLAASLPEKQTDERLPRLSILCHGYPGPGDLWRVEVWASTRPRGDVPPNELRVRFEDANGTRLDEVRRPFDDAVSRSTLRGLWPEIPASENGWIQGLGALLPAGPLLVTVDVLGHDDRILASQDARVDFRARQKHRGFGVSELMACDVYRDDLQSLPPCDPSFVRHDMAIVPRVDSVLAPGQTSFAVYYEVFEAVAGNDGQTHLDVDYTIYRSVDYDPYTRGPQSRDGRLARPVLRHTYPDERTGRTRTGTVIKGTRISVEDFEPGVYVLVTTVTDRLAHKESRRTLQFGVPGPAPQ